MARGLLNQAIEWDPSAVEPRLVLAEIERRAERFEHASVHYRAVLDIDPTSPEGHAGFADLLAVTGRVAEAVVHYRAALRSSEDSSSIQLRLGDALVRTGAYAEAIERYRRGLWKTDADHATLNRIAWLLATCPQIELRDCAQAIRVAEHLCVITGYGNAVALDTLAAAYAECDRLAEAVNWAQTAIDMALSEKDTATAESIRPRLRAYRNRLSE